MIKPFAESDFLVTFRGESPESRLIRTWDKVLGYLDYAATNGSEEESFRAHDNDIHNMDSWSMLGHVYPDNDDERHEYQCEIGEGVYLTVTRITTPIEETWVDKKTEDTILDLRAEIAKLKRQLGSQPVG